METHTKKLLEECNSGCKMGINSMKQISDYIKDEKLKDLVNEYIRKHQDLEKETSRLLEQSGEEEKSRVLWLPPFLGYDGDEAYDKG